MDGRYEAPGSQQFYGKGKGEHFDANGDGIGYLSAMADLGAATVARPKMRPHGVAWRQPHISEYSQDGMDGEYQDPKRARYDGSDDAGESGGWPSSDSNGGGAQGSCTGLYGYNGGKPAFGKGKFDLFGKSAGKGTILTPQDVAMPPAHLGFALGSPSWGHRPPLPGGPLSPDGGGSNLNGSAVPPPPVDSMSAIGSSAPSMAMAMAPGLVPAPAPPPIMTVAEPPPRPVYLAPATASITPVSTKLPKNKQIAVEFVNSSKEKQAEMLQDPSVARAILQMIAELPRGGAAQPQMASLLGQRPEPPTADGNVAFSPSGTQAWSGVMTIARNMSKRVPVRAVLVHGRVQDVEVALRSAAGNSNVLDVTHRTPFDDVTRRMSSGTIVSMSAPSPLEQATLEEYFKYFRTKMRAGMVKLEGSYSLYLLPPCEEIPAVRDAIIALGGNIPRVGCLLGVIVSGVTPPVKTPVKQATSAVSAAPATVPAAKAEHLPIPLPAPAAEDAVVPPMEEAGADAGNADAGSKDEDGELSMSSKEIVDLFSNPELIKLLSDEAVGGENGATS